MEERKVVVYIAQSLDGYIASETDDLTWLSMVEVPGEDYGYSVFIGSVDTVIMGRRTYEKVKDFGEHFIHEGRKCYVVSKTIEGSDRNVEYYGGDLRELVLKLKGQPGKDIFVDGGGETIRSLRDEDLIDEYVVSIIPIMLGRGIRLFPETGRAMRSVLLMEDCKTFPSGLVQLKYRRVDSKP